MILQTQVNTAITSAGNSVTNMFKSVTSGAGGKQVAALSRPAGSRARIDGASAVTFVMALPLLMGLLCAVADIGRAAYLGMEADVAAPGRLPLCGSARRARG